jgi:hypothetical protein
MAERHIYPSGITDTAELLSFLRHVPIAFYNSQFMDSNFALLRPVAGEVLAIYDAQPDSLLNDLPKPSGFEERMNFNLENLTLKFDRGLDLEVSYCTGVPMRTMWAGPNKEVWASKMSVLQFRAADGNLDYVFCPSCSALESIGLRRDARFVEQTSNCRYACVALKDRTLDSEGRYKWQKGNFFLGCCCCSQRMHDSGEPPNHCVYG